MSFPVLSGSAWESREQSQVRLRYEDVSQDGRLKATTLPMAMGSLCYERLWLQHPLVVTINDGILPILSRMVLECDSSPTTLGTNVEVQGAIELAYERNADEQVSALVLNMLGEVYGPLGRSIGAPVPDAGKRVRLGRVFCEHVFTRPFGPPSERKVLSFNVPGQPPLPAARYQRRTLTELLQLPEQAQALDADFESDIAPWVFGVMHTDSNQHVNSLVYPRLFEEAALRRLAQHGRNVRLLSRSIECVYRKPCFAGEQVRCMLRTFEYDGVVGAVGYLISGDAPVTRAHCAMRLIFQDH